NPYGAMWITSVVLGLSPGEAAGLAWKDLDLEAGVIHVRHGLQRGEGGGSQIGDTKNGYRIRSLDAPPPVIVALRAHRVRQHEQQLAAGHVWCNEYDLVFTSPTGGPTDPTATRAEFRSVVKAAQLPGRWTPN